VLAAVAVDAVDVDGCCGSIGDGGRTTQSCLEDSSDSIRLEIRICLLEEGDLFYGYKREREKLCNEMKKKWTKMGGFL
jgi:hypothetical protein